MYTQCKICFVVILMLISLLFCMNIVQAETAKKFSLYSPELFDREQVINSIILANYRELRAATITLMDTVVDFCADENTKKQHTIQQAFIQVRFAWAKAQIVTFGPISFLRRKERFDFWPDKHRVGERQVRNLLNLTTPLPEDLLALQNKSVAIQGLGALERMLYAKSGFVTEKQCHLSILIAENLANIAGEVFAQWSEKPILFQNDLLNPQSGITFFADASEVVSTIANDMTTQLRIVSDIKLARSLPTRGKNKGNFRKLEAWRTGRSFQLMLENISTVQLYYELGFAESLQYIDPSLHQDLTQLFALSIKQLSALNEQAQTNLSTVFKEPDFLEKIRESQASIQQIDQLIKTKLLARYGLTLKFNALDGD